MDKEPLVRACATPIPLLADDHQVARGHSSPRSLWLPAVASVLVLALACASMVVLTRPELAPEYTSGDHLPAHTTASSAMPALEYTRTIEDTLADTLTSILTNFTPWRVVEDKVSDQPETTIRPTPTTPLRTRVRKREQVRWDPGVGVQ